VGVWVDHRFSWVGREWKRELKYRSSTLVTEVDLYHREMGLLLACEDAVDFHENVLVRQIAVENLEPRKREIRLFFANNLSISGNDVGDTAAFDPKTGGVVHYKGPRYFLANGMAQNSDDLAGFAVGQKGHGAHEGTYRDAEDGVLSGNPICPGIGGFRDLFEPDSRRHVSWNGALLACGRRDVA
jgi:glucoamylase